MTSRDSLIRIFWPSNTPRSHLPGVVVGWKNSDLEFFVVTILDAVEVRVIMLAISMIFHADIVSSQGALRMRCGWGSCIETVIIRSLDSSSFAALRRCTYSAGVIPQKSRQRWTRSASALTFIPHADFLA